MCGVKGIERKNTEKNEKKVGNRNSIKGG